MNETIKNDLKINGSGKFSGGFYNNVIINGSGMINGDIDCNGFKVNGSGSVNGSVKCETGVVSGSCNISGKVYSNEFKVNGSTKVGGDATSKILRINGSMIIEGSLNGEDFQNRGSFKANGDCTLEKFDSKGGFSISGLLNAEDINIEIYGPCSVREIGGQTVKANIGRSFGVKKLVNTIMNILNLKEELSAELIEADDIYLENTKARVVSSLPGIRVLFIVRLNLSNIKTNSLTTDQMF